MDILLLHQVLEANNSTLEIILELSKRRKYKSIATLPIILNLFIRDSHEKLHGFADILEQKSDLEFFKLCRITKETFSTLLQEISSHQFFQRIEGGGKPKIEPRVSLFMTLWYLGKPCSYIDIAEHFAISKSAAHGHIKGVINILNEMAPAVIRWPTLSTVSSVEAEFRKLANFPGVIGAIDGCHIRIKAPAKHQIDFLDRTMNHSVNLLAICDSFKRFTFISAGFPGSAHDQRVFSLADLGIALKKNHKAVCFSDKYHIVGDSAFALALYLMVPFKDTGELDASQIVFNTKLSMTRRVIENAFAWLKGRFRRLKYIDAEVGRVPDIITAACVLHNITINSAKESDLLQREIEVDTINTRADNNVNPAYLSKTKKNALAVKKRCNIAKDLQKQ